MKKNVFLSLLILVITSSSLLAQETWSLEKCIDHAWQNNLGIKQSQIAIKNAELTEKGSKLNRYPSVNASGNYGYQFGRTIDPTTNGFISTNVGFNNLSINANATLYNGGRLNNLLEQSQIDMQAAQADMMQTKNDIGLAVATAYLNVLFAEEQLANAQKRSELTKSQLDQTDKLIKAGSLPQNDRLDILAQMALDNQNIVIRKNAVDNSYLSLKNLLELDPSLDMTLEKPQMDVPENTGVEGLTLESIYQTALGNQPFVQAGELRQRSAEMSVDIAKADMLPRLTAFASMDTRFSTLGKRSNGTQIITIPQTVTWMGNETTFEIDNEVPIIEDNPYFNQLSDNLGQAIGLAISIPIYNNRRSQIAMERAELNIINTQVTNQRQRQQLKIDVQTAIANANAAKLQLEASETSVQALKAAYANSQKRFQLGAINSLQLTTSKNNLDTAEVDYIVAKYDYLFRLKILDFYQGKSIK